MTNILNMLTPEQLKALEGVKASLVEPLLDDGDAMVPELWDRLTTYTIDTATEPEDVFAGDVFAEAINEALKEQALQPASDLSWVQGVPAGHDWDGGDVVMHQYEEPVVTTINGVEYDLRSEAFAETKCLDCLTSLSVEVAPKGVNLDMLNEYPREAVCAPCGAKRVLGKQGTLVHDATTTLEDDVAFDLTNFSNAQLGEAAGKVRDRMRLEATEKVKEGSKKAKKKRIKEAAENKASLKADRAKQGKHKEWMGEFTVAGKTVPALDFTEVGLDELVPPKMRSPYNKALHALGEPLLNKEEATYRLVRDLHRSLYYSDPEVTSATSKPQQRLLADINPDAKAKVEAFAQVTGKTYDEAHKHLASINLI